MISAPIAGTATAGATRLLSESSISIPLLAVVPMGMWAKASISPLSELAREAGEALRWTPKMRQLAKVEPCP